MYETPANEVTEKGKRTKPVSIYPFEVMIIVVWSRVFLTHQSEKICLPLVQKCVCILIPYYSTITMKKTFLDQKYIYLNDLSTVKLMMSDELELTRSYLVLSH